jgi:hypothetical protein
MAHPSRGCRSRFAEGCRVRVHKPIASDLLTSGWLPPRAAAEKHGVTVGQLMAMTRRGEVRRRMIAPGIFLYETPR